MKEEMKSLTQLSAGTARRICPSLPQQKIMTAIAILLAGFLSLCGFSQTHAAEFSGSLKSVSISTENNPAPVASFTYTITGSTVAFNAVASGNVSKFTWDFGDNAKGEGATATHQYNGLGTYQATLTAIDQNGSATAYQSSFSLAPQSGGSLAPSSGNLLHQKNLIYRGAFRLPQGTPQGATGCDSPYDCIFAYGGGPIAYNPPNMNDGKGTLFIGSCIYSQKIAEVSIPSPIASKNLEGLNMMDMTAKLQEPYENNLKELNTATLLQGFYDIMKGNKKNILDKGAPYPDEVQSGGLMVYEDKFIGSVFTYFPGPTQVLSHYVSSKNLSSEGSFSGMFKIGTAVPARYLANYIDSVPKEWQEKLGGTAITGGGGLAIISTTSAGPSAFAFDPAALTPELLTKDRTAPASTLMYYPLEHPVSPLSDDGAANSNYNLTARIRGVVFPDGTDSVLFFGVIGVGEVCYGIGTADRSLVGKPVPNGIYNEIYDCYDPESNGKGFHAWPYMYQVWAYDAHDFVKVKNGDLNQATGRKWEPWEVMPYGVWQFRLPFQPGRPELLGTSYDRKHQTLYISQDAGDGALPLIHVFEIDPTK